ncbi:cytochrome P450 [Mastigocladopsis repens]|uniref:cytochrome P450 n=1 Tax=Mastigocladopsis repens TaxID=221287 RepID=UPI00031E16FC|nr:cytochrome P450 [Mastigocladopsis repens]
MVKQSISPNVRKTPSGPRSYPIIGCFPQMASNPLQFLTNAAREYGDVVHLGPIGPQQLYLVTHPDGVKHILLDNFHNYVKGDNFKDKDFTLLVGNGLINSEGDAWRRQRRLLQPAFHSRQQIAAMVSLMTNVIEELLEQWRSIENTQIDVAAEMLELSQKIVIKALLSLDPNSSETAQIIQAWHTVLGFHTDRIWAFFKVPLSVPTPKNVRFLQAVETINTIVYRLIRERRQSSNDYDDLLSWLINARHESGEGLSDELVRDEIVALFVAGFDTSATSLGWVWYMLSQHPNVESKLQEELATVLGGRTPTYEDIPNLKYTKMVIQETMRLYPAVWILSMTNVADDEICGYHIPAGSMIVLSPFVTHHLPSIWENPDKFDPERWSPERSAGRPWASYLPFGGGPRQCLGDVFVTTEMQLIIAMVSQHLRLKLVPGHPVEMDTRLALRSRHGLPMTLEPRKSRELTLQNVE